jgi:hypothetical protein
MDGFIVFQYLNTQCLFIIYKYIRYVYQKALASLPCNLSGFSKLVFVILRKTKNATNKFLNFLNTGFKFIYSFSTTLLQNLIGCVKLNQGKP